MRWKIALLALLLASLLFGVRSPEAASADGDKYDQSKVPLEIEPTDPSLAKIVLVAGRRSHGPMDHEFFAGSALLMKLLQQTPGVFPVMVRDGWPKNEKIFQGAKAVVFYMDGGSGHPLIQQGRLGQFQKYIDQKVGFVNLHYAVEYPKSQSDHVLNWLGPLGGWLFRRGMYKQYYQ